jgi:AraC family transcriptional regulator
MEPPRGTAELAAIGALDATTLRRIADHVEAHLDSDIALEALARLAGLSTFYFTRMFKQTTGTTPYQYVIRARLARARSLLVGSALPLAAIALECGFDSQAHLTSTFTRAFGQTPGRYRRLASRGRMHASGVTMTMGGSRG